MACPHIKAGLGSKDPMSFWHFVIQDDYQQASRRVRFQSIVCCVPNILALPFHLPSLIPTWFSCPQHFSHGLKAILILLLLILHH